ncbi:uncharacterized protein LOC126584567 [Malus sylvestris]|uniref:uncharacterized protein LOC126584567 n=1 Tax=Malus sylvestris TaxID=3752 RepID=UPI0021ACE6DC|nr:uncharacterized protein LOC126584567 [Malus sylvestris]
MPPYPIQSPVPRVVTPSGYSGVPRGGTDHYQSYGRPCAPTNPYGSTVSGAYPGSAATSFTGNAHRHLGSAGDPRGLYHMELQLLVLSIDIFFPLTLNIMEPINLLRRGTTTDCYTDSTVIILTP